MNRVCVLFYSFLLLNSIVSAASTPRTCEEIHKGIVVRVTVTRDGHDEGYMRTNRGLRSFRQLIRGTTYRTKSEIDRGLRFFSKQFLNGKDVLDAGTGDGATVEEMRKLGANAVGTDIFLNPSQKKKSYFEEQDTTALQFKDANFDVVMSNYSVLHYGESKEIVKKTFLELKRVLKPGGYLILGGNTRYRYWNEEAKADYSDLEVIGHFQDVEIFRKRQ